MPDIEGVPYEATGGKLDQATAQALAARHREAASAGVGAASAAGASALADAKTYTDQKVSPLATTVAMNAADALTLSNAKTYTDEQLAGFNGNGVETVSGTVTLDATGEPIREHYTIGATTYRVNGTTVSVGAYTAVVWKRDGSNVWAWQQVVDGWQTPTPTPDTQAPTAGTLAVSVTDVSASLTVSGATDDRGVTGYAWSKDGGTTWTTWQSGASYEFTGLTASTSYSFRHKVRDAAGNETLGTTVSKTTDVEAPWGQVWADDFTTREDGSIFGKQMQSAPSPTVYVPFGLSDTSRVEAGKLVGHKSISNTNQLQGMGGQVSLGDGITRVSMTLNLYIGGMHGSGVVFLLWGQSQGVTSGIMTGNTLDHRYGFQLNNPDLTGSGGYTTTELPFTTGHTTRSTVTVYADATINQARDEATVTVTSSTGAVLHDQAKIPVQGGTMFGVYGTVASTTDLTYLNRWEVRAE